MALLPTTFSRWYPVKGSSLNHTNAKVNELAESVGTTVNVSTDEDGFTVLTISTPEN